MSAQLARIDGALASTTPSANALAPVAAPAPLKTWQVEKLDMLLLQIKPAIDAWRNEDSDKVVLKLLMSCADIGRSTAYRWLTDLKTHGLDGLADGHKRSAIEYPWHKRCYQLYRLRSQPNAGDITEQLITEGFPRWIKNDPATEKGVSYSRVAAFIKRIPADKGEYSAARMGASYRRANHMPKKKRDVTQLEVGEVWVSDGHKMKILCRHHITDNVYRLEMTPTLDVRSHYWFSTWYSKAESAASVVNVFCSTVRKYRKRPRVFYTDNGSGFKNSRTQAMFLRLNIDHRFAKPGASYAKGQGENIFTFVINRFAKFAFPDAYCGDDITDDVIARYAKKYKDGEIYIPTDLEVIDACNAYRVRYNATPQPNSKRLNGQAPDAFIGQLKPDAEQVDPRIMLFQERESTVRKGTITFAGFSYPSRLLYPYEGKRMRVLFDGGDAALIWVWDERGEYVGDIALDAEVYFDHPSVDARDRQRKVIDASNRKLKLARNIVEDMTATAIEGTDMPTTIQLLEQGHSLSLPTASKREAELLVLPADSPANTSWDDNWSRIQAEAKQRLADQL